MIVPRLRSEARGGSSSGASTRYSTGVYGSKVHGQHANDPDLKRALQYSYTSQAVRKWEKRWVVIHETSMRVHKWMPAPATAPTLASQIVADKTAALANNNTDQSQEETQIQQQQEQQESTPTTTEDTQMMVDEESTSQSSQA
ncbi:unnamed protein product [Adineta steineri]|uniref:Uncharacterized protein n=1 Tax=Adineta steineri TaxID=433720 RepID=A0A815THR5_9BILA|nr:unnamed protein product [Adineta steineri]CAF1645035.1 unnamed protein product [Adineta steineri]